MSEVQEMFNSLSERFDPEEWEGVDAVIQFVIEGEGGGKWKVTVQDGEMALEEGEVEEPDMTFGADYDDMKAILKGELNGVSAYMQGKVSIEGDLTLAMKLQSLLS
ncbi:MAG: SCP2 sterol-binding domain-containing protein [Chloroflexi bacterium]|nr:SCP2 sterol-binding domain-containing protein [Chloroflexota bacterium]